MAGYVIHRMVGEDVAAQLPADHPWRPFIDGHRAAFLWGAQGPDTLFHDGPFLTLSAKRGPINEYGGFMHRQKTPALFRRISLLLEEKRDTPEFPALAAVAAGFLCHYCVDRRIHAYVYSFMKQLRGAVKTWRPTGVHSMLETDMDTAYYRLREGKDVRRCRVEPEMRTAREDIQAVETFLLDLIANVFGREFPAGSVTQCIEYFWHKENFLFDASGIKSRLFCRLKELVHGERISYTLYCRPEKVDYDVLNMGHTPWVCPLEPDKITRSSVPEQLELAEAEAQALITEMARLVAAGQPFSRERMDSFDCGSDGSIQEP